MSLPSRLLGANPSIQVSTLLSGSLTTPSAKGTFELGSFDSIATTTLTTATASITFSSIPSTYTHLQIRGIARSVGANVNITVQLNSDTGSNYTYHNIIGNGAAVTANGGASSSVLYLGFTPETASTASCFSGTVIDILDYTNTNKYTTLRSITGSDLNGSGSVRFMSGAWLSTSAVTSVVLTISGSDSFQQYSSFALYGIKG